MSGTTPSVGNYHLQPDPLQLTRYLKLVDDQIDGTGLELLKLSLYAHEFLPWIEAVKCDKPSALFKLLETRPSTENALRLLLFSLRAIGGKTHGKYCASEAKKHFPTPSQVNPNPETRQFCLPSELEIGIQTRKFCLFQWLVKISRKLPPDASERVIRHFARDPRVQMNQHNYKGLPQLFIDLHQKGVITDDDTSSLENELRGCRQIYAREEQSEDLAKLEKCIDYLENFHSTQQTAVFYLSEGDEETTADSLVESTSLSASADHESESSQVPMRKRVLQSARAREQKRKANQDQQDDSPEKSLTSLDNHFPPRRLSGAFSRQQSGASTATVVGRTPLCSPSGSVQPSHRASTSPSDSARDRPSRPAYIPPPPSVCSTHSLTATAPDVPDNETETPDVEFHGHPDPPPTQRAAPDVPDNETKTPDVEFHGHPDPPPPQRADTEMTAVHHAESTESIEEKRQKKRLCRIGIIALIIAVVVFSPIVPCLTKVWLPLQKLSSTLTTRQRQGDAVVLRSVDLFLTENVSVTEQVYHHDSPHEVDVYLTPRDCQHLPTYWNTTEHSATNLKFKNSTPIYMLAGSRLSYNICASTDSKQKDNIELYIVAGLNDILHFNPDEAREDKHYYYKSIPVDMPCTKVLQHVHSPNYYASIFLIPPQPLNITYQLNTSVLSINVTALELTSTHVGTVNNDNDEVHSSLNFGTNKKCLTAVIHPGAGQYMNVHIELNFALQKYAIIISVCSYVTFILILVLAMVVIWGYKKRNIIEVFVRKRLSSYNLL